MTIGGLVHPLKGLVLHIQQGYEVGTNATFHNPASKASAHFGNPKKGGLDQWVDTNDKAWAQAAGNPYWISLENEGFTGDALTGSQIENAAQLLAWLHKTEGIPLQVTDNVNVGGLGWHGMGGAAWGGHVNCPGQPIKDQRQQIIDRAKVLLGQVPPAAPAVVPVKLGTIGGKPVSRATLNFPNNLVSGKVHNDYFDTGLAWSKVAGEPVFNPALNTWDDTPDLQIVEYNGQARVKLVSARPAGSGFGFWILVTD